MRCITPITVLKNTRKVRSWAKIAQEVPCGKCPACLARRSTQWSFRLWQHLKVSKTSVFLTLTYSDENLPVTANGRYTLLKRDLQLFMKRLRKQNERKVKYYACGEYGSHTHRPHYHMLLFDLDDLFCAHPEILQAIWKDGHIYCGNVRPASIRYVCGYIDKGGMSLQDYVDEDTGEILIDDRNPEFSVMSKGLGLNYLTPKMVDYHVANLLAACTLPGGTLVSMPRYYRDRIFSEHEKLAIKDEQRLLAKFDFGQFVEDVYHDVQYRKDQFRKADKKAFERIKI